MKRTKAEIARAWESLQQFRGCPIASVVNSVSRSGMSRRIELYALKDNNIHRIGWAVAYVADYPYDIDKGGIRADGCVMDMVFSVVSNFNYVAAEMTTGKTIQELLATGECGKHIYDDYFFNANNIRSI